MEEDIKTIERAFRTWSTSTSSWKSTTLQKSSETNVYTNVIYIGTPINFTVCIIYGLTISNLLRWLSSFTVNLKKRFLQRSVQALQTARKLRRAKKAKTERLNISNKGQRKRSVEPSATRNATNVSLKCYANAAPRRQRHRDRRHGATWMCQRM